MHAIKYLDRLKRINKLTKTKTTGNPKELARKLGISESHLYRYIEEIKEMGVPINYCRYANSYYYTKAFDLSVNYSIKLISEEECKQISAGFSIKKASLLFYESGQS